MLKNKKIIFLIAITLMIVIAGIVMLFVKGLNYNLAFDNNTTVELYLETEFENSDIQNIITEVFGNNIEIRQINNLKKDILIITKSATDEQLNNLITKVNEKYNLKLTTDDLLITNNAKINVLDLIAPYVLPVCITALAILVYFIIRYKKIGIAKVVLFTILTIVLTQLLLLSIYAIMRIPVNELAMPISMLIYIISIILITGKFESDLTKLEQEQEQ